MFRISSPRLRVLALCALAWGTHAGEPASAPQGGQASTEPAGRRWSHPSKEYPRSVRRWFADLPPALQYSELRVRKGDDPRWAHPGWNDADWAAQGFWDLPARAGVHWARFRVRMAGTARSCRRE